MAQVMIRRDSWAWRCPKLCLEPQVRARVAQMHSVGAIRAERARRMRERTRVLGCGSSEARLVQRGRRMAVPVLERDE